MKSIRWIKIVTRDDKAQYRDQQQDRQFLIFSTLALLPKVQLISFFNNFWLITMLFNILSITVYASMFAVCDWN